MKIEERQIYAIDRRQFTGFDHSPLTLLTGEQLQFQDFKSAIEPTCEQACEGFDARLPTFLSDKPGVILWRDKPTAIHDLDGWRVHCRFAVTEDMRFTDAANLVTPEVIYPGKHKTEAMTTEEMLVRK